MIEKPALRLTLLRLRHEFRRSAHRTGELRARVLGILYPFWYVAFPVGCWYGATGLLPMAERGGFNPAAMYWAVIIVTGIAVCLTTATDAVKTLALDRQSDLLALSTLPPSHVAGYQMILILGRNLPFLAGMFMHPIYLSVVVPADPQGKIVFSALVVAVYFWLLAVAVSVPVHVLALAGRMYWPRKTVASASFALFAILLAIGVMLVLNGADRWFAERMPRALPPLWVPAVAAASLTGAGFLHLRQAVARWIRAITAADFAPQRAATANGTASPFSEVPSRAVLQKDLRDLRRNPAHRWKLLFVLLFLGAAIYSQARGVVTAEAVANRRLLFQLSLLQLVPCLVFSGRAMSLEQNLLDLYRTVLPDLRVLLWLKIRAQSLVNLAVVVLGALPFYVALRPAPGWREIGAFTGAAIVYVPLLTVLAVALGTLFPGAPDSADPFGMKKRGVLAYILLTLPLYGFLLNRMATGTALYSLFLLAATGALHALARRRLQCRD